MKCLYKLPWSPCLIIAIGSNRGTDLSEMTQRGTKLTGGEGPYISHSSVYNSHLSAFPMICWQMSVLRPSLVLPWTCERSTNEKKPKSTHSTAFTQEQAGSICRGQGHVAGEAPEPLKGQSVFLVPPSLPHPATEIQQC